MDYIVGLTSSQADRCHLLHLTATGSRDLHRFVHCRLDAASILVSGMPFPWLQSAKRSWTSFVLPASSTCRFPRLEILFPIMIISSFKIKLILYQDPNMNNNASNISRNYFGSSITVQQICVGSASLVVVRNYKQHRSSSGFSSDSLTSSSSQRRVYKPKSNTHKRVSNLKWQSRSHRPS